MNYHYPPLTAGALRAVVVALEESSRHGPAYMEGAPWGADVKEMLRTIGAQASEEAAQDVSGWLDDEGEVDVLKVLRTLQRDMDTLKKSSTSMEPNEKIAVMRMSVTLSEKILSQQERAMNLKWLRELRERVVTAMTKYLTPDQRESFLQDLENPS